uniref:Uncharacterized protein n=1 Tax=Arundo donax TaxID=35708 RepID=A0A0A9GH52_ARUDO
MAEMCPRIGLRLKVSLVVQKLEQHGECKSQPLYLFLLLLALSLHLSHGT